MTKYLIKRTIEWKDENSKKHSDIYFYGKGVTFGSDINYLKQNDKDMLDKYSMTKATAVKKLKMFSNKKHYYGESPDFNYEKYEIFEIT